jgi:hypothetical protein
MNMPAGAAAAGGHHHTIFLYIKINRNAQIWCFNSGTSRRISASVSNDEPHQISGWIGKKLFCTTATFAPNSEIWAGDKGGIAEDLVSMVDSMGLFQS